MDFILVDLILTPFGWLILFFKYQKRSKVKSIVKYKYDNSYANVAKDYLFTSFIILFILLLLVLIMMSVISIFRE